MAGKPLTLIRAGRRPTAALIALAMCASLLVAAPVAANGEQGWVSQFGTPNIDHASQAAATEDAVYVASTVGGDGAYPPTQGRASLRRYTHNGALIWERFLAGSTGQTAANSVAADDTGIYVGGYTQSALPGQPAIHGWQVAWVARYSDAGDLIWARQFALNSRYATGVNFLQATSAGILAAGCIDEMCDILSVCPLCDGGFVQLIDRDGTAQWTKRVHGDILAMDADRGGALLSVSVAFSSSSLQRLNQAGNVVWTRMTDFTADGVALLDGGAYVVTYAPHNDLDRPERLRAYRADGTLDWERIATGTTVDRTPVFVDTAAGNIVLAWWAPHSGVALEGTTWWAAYSLDGTFRWRHFLPGLNTAPSSVIATPRGGYVTGSRSGAFPGQTNHGSVDAFVFKFTIDTTDPFTAWEVLCPGDCSLPEFRLPPDLATLDLHWRGSDAGSGIDRFQLQMTSNGGANWSNVLLGEPRARSVSADVKPGDAYRFRLRAFDKSGNASSWKRGPLYTVGLPQETDASFIYDADWKPATVPGADGGSVMTASDPGAKATFSFKGSSIGLVTTLGPDRGKATVYLDGVKAGVIDLHAPIQVSREVAFTHAWAHPGNHTLTLVVRGTAGRPRVDIDAIEVVSITP